MTLTSKSCATLIGALPHRGDPAGIQCRPRRRVMIQYTSGTGFPKAALHHGLVTNANHYFDRLGVAPGDHFILMMPLFRTAGSAMNVLGCSSTRCTQVLVPPSNRARARADRDLAGWMSACRRCSSR